MTILDDLLTFDGYVSEGRELNQDMFHQRSWLDKLRNKPAEPEYRLHKTTAGFPLVLPHKKDGQLYTSDAPAGSTSLAYWCLSGPRIILPFNFYLISTAVLRGAEGTVQLCCQTQKYFDKSFEKNDYFFIFDEGIRMAYLVTPQGEISTVEISYHINGADGSRDVSFAFLREKDSGRVKVLTKISAGFDFDFDGRMAMRPVDKDIFQASPLNYERTIQNLVKIIKKEIFTEEDRTLLFNLQYLSASALSPYASALSPVPNKKLMN